MKTNLTDTTLWTYGAELELSDLDTRKGLPDGFGWDKRDVTMVNTNGVAVDPKQKVYPFGGEVNTPPTKTIKGQVAKFRELLEFHSDATINHRSNLHLHIRVPGLNSDLSACKKIQRYIHANPGFLDTVEPIPKPRYEDFPVEAEYTGAMRRYRRRLVSHHTVLSTSRFEKQQKANSFDEFFAAECPLDKKTKKPLFHLAPRCAINLRQLRETNTIEFRHFPGTLDPAKFKSCLRWCRDWLLEALTTQSDPISLFNEADPPYDIPKFKKYVHWREVGYRMTVHDGTVKPASIVKNVEGIVSGKINLCSSSDLSVDIPKSKHPADNLRVFNIRGTSGSGKSTLVFNLLKNFKSKVVRSGGDKPFVAGYVIPKLNLFVVGKYSNPTGGTDAMSDPSTQIVFRVKAGIEAGYNVLFEGLLVSGIKSTPLEIAGLYPLVAFSLTTPIETCLANVRSRRAARGETKELDPKNTITKGQAVLSSHKALEAHPNVKIFSCSNDKAFRLIVKRLSPGSTPTWSNNPTKELDFSALS